MSRATSSARLNGTERMNRLITGMKNGPHAEIVEPHAEQQQRAQRDPTPSRRT